MVFAYGRGLHYSKYFLFSVDGLADRSSLALKDFRSATCGWGSTVIEATSITTYSMRMEVSGTDGRDGAR